MNYNDFGKTGEKVSSLGFGCMRLPEYQENEKWFIDQDKASEMIGYAFENGVNYFDTAPYYCNKNSEEALGKAVKKFRSKVMLSTKIPLEVVKGPSDYRKTLEASLKRMDTDYVDFYHFWGINKGSFDDIIMQHDLLLEAQKAKEEGLIRHISFSFHDEPQSIKYIIDGSIKRGISMETMLVQYNLLDRSNEEMLAYAASKGLGTVAMGPVGGGRLSAPTDLYTKLTGKPAIATYELAFKFVLGNPNLSCALSGMETLDMVQKNVKIGNDPAVLSEMEWEQLGKAMEQLKKFSELYCTGCKYCQPCPSEIKIPDIFNFYNNHNVYGLTETAKNQFAGYRKDGGKAISDCIDCGVCEKKCPQHLKIREELARVEKILLSF
ncbi:aldo/keto reductase [Ruminiclostridium cellobioparum]|uniref:Putative oxidoreductases of the aldo/keto reductase family n=1 Tax=Ruminiclostridium cellobioparum subsp. termitidis CT1112 TaxID=1195236 RepID=S0FIY6_RUMCE|nr:aldo/keto reductase [Ruminiclostridium cellobioparum]EMS70181.1 putative oxidoreductases of the aldo/keto reductase family [Ruminiclostridium cellobioparum subsp. termitidis CT1112]